MWKDNIKVGLKGIGWGGWTGFICNRMRTGYQRL